MSHNETQKILQSLKREIADSNHGKTVALYHCWTAFVSKETPLTGGVTNRGTPARVVEILCSSRIRKKKRELEQEN